MPYTQSRCKTSQFSGDARTIDFSMMLPASNVMAASCDAPRCDGEIDAGSRSAVDYSITSSATPATFYQVGGRDMPRESARPMPQYSTSEFSDSAGSPSFPYEHYGQVTYDAWSEFSSTQWSTWSTINQLTLEASGYEAWTISLRARKRNTRTGHRSVARESVFDFKTCVGPTLTLDSADSHGEVVSSTPSPKHNSPAIDHPCPVAVTTPLLYLKKNVLNMRIQDYPRRKLHTTDYRPGPCPLLQRLANHVSRWMAGDDVVAQSQLLQTHKRSPYVNFRRLLSQNIAFYSIKMRKNHTHRAAASLRTSMAATIEQTIVKAGYIPYSVSMSARDKYDGCRYVYMPKDMDKTFRDDAIGPEHVIMLIDVDYYTNINAYLAYGNPIMLYTFVPTTAGGDVLDGCFSIRDNVVTYMVSGGATYVHQLWNYIGDTVAVLDHYNNLLSYAIEQMVCPEDPNRRIITL